MIITEESTIELNAAVATFVAEALNIISEDNDEKYYRLAKAFPSPSDLMGDSESVFDTETWKKVYIRTCKQLINILEPERN